MLDKDAYDVGITLLHCHMQRRPPVVGPSCHVHTVLDEDAHDLRISLSHRHMQRTPTIVGPGCRARTGTLLSDCLDMDLSDLHNFFRRRL
jgi:hypothetical protein